MEIKNTTVYDKKFFTYFQRLSMRVSIPAVVILTIAIAIIAVAFAFTLYDAVYYIVYFDYYGEISSPMLFLALLVFYALYFTFLPSMMFKKSHTKNATVKYTFFDDKFTNETIGEGYNSTLEYSYGSIKKVCESPKCFIIYVDKMSVCAVDKAGFLSEDSIEKLAELLKDTVGKKKYVKRK